VINDDIHWMEEFDNEDREELESLTVQLVEDALAFYDSEMENFE
jgi:hypothetical protein